MGSTVVMAMQMLCVAFVVWGGVLCLVGPGRREARRPASARATDFEIGFRRALMPMKRAA